MSEYANEDVLTVEELILLTKRFIKLADELYEADKLSKEEYDELTLSKKNFVTQAEKEKQFAIDRIF